MEIKRIEGIKFDYFYAARCINCEKELLLYHDDGELDYRSCCGHTYRLKHSHQGIDLVIYEEEHNKRDLLNMYKVFYQMHGSIKYELLNTYQEAMGFLIDCESQGLNVDCITDEDDLVVFDNGQDVPGKMGLYYKG